MDTSHQPYLLELSHRLSTYQDLDANPFTPKKEPSGLCLILKIKLCYSLAIQHTGRNYASSTRLQVQLQQVEVLCQFSQEDLHPNSWYQPPQLT